MWQPPFHAPPSAPGSCFDPGQPPARPKFKCISKCLTSPASERVGKDRRVSSQLWARLTFAKKVPDGRALSPVNWLRSQNRKPRKSGRGGQPGPVPPTDQCTSGKGGHSEKKGKLFWGKEKAKRMLADKPGQSSSNTCVRVYISFYGASRSWRQSPIFRVYCVRRWQGCAELQFCSDNDSILNRERR